MLFIIMVPFALGALAFGNYVLFPRVGAGAAWLFAVACAFASQAALLAAPWWPPAVGVSLAFLGMACLGFPAAVPSVDVDHAGDLALRHDDHHDDIVRLGQRAGAEDASTRRRLWRLRGWRLTLAGDGGARDRGERDALRDDAAARHSDGAPRDVHVEGAVDHAQDGVLKTARTPTSRRPTVGCARLRSRRRGLEGGYDPSATRGCPRRWWRRPPRW